MADQEFKIDSGNRILMVISLLALAAAVVFLVYHLIGFLGQVAIGEREPVPALTGTVDDRMAPIGRVVVARVDPDAAPTAPKPAGEVFRTVCAACHETGAAGAPRIADRAEWLRRFNEKGLDTLVSHSINGFQGMPARGGNPGLSDEEVGNTVRFMLAEAGVDAGGPAPTTGAAVEEAAPVAGAAAGDAAAGQARYAACVSCHGPQGQGMGIFPKIAGQSAEYIAGKLTAYRAGETVGPTTALMAPQAMGLTDKDIADLAAYIASF